MIKIILKLNALAKYLILLLALVALIYTMFWLWQRQPKVQKIEEPQSESTPTTANLIPKSDFNPPSFSIVSQNPLKLEGEGVPNALAFIYSNKEAKVAKTDGAGKFDLEINFAGGLNLFQVTIVTNDLKPSTGKSLIYFLSEKNQSAKTVYAGTVKTIFENLITVATADGNKKVKTTKQTQIKLPSAPDQEKATVGAFSQIRVGDFLIALGNINPDDTLASQEIEIIRKDKPQLKKQLAGAKILSTVGKNLFSVKITTTEEIGEFTLEGNSQILVGESLAKTGDIQKNKNAVIIFELQDNKKIVSLLYLLP